VWQHNGEITEWRYEPIKGFCLGIKMSYTPDFLLVRADEEIVWIEVKGGHIYEKDWLKFKMAASRYPWWRFVLAQYAEARWTFKDAASQEVLCP
jgi:hypothetical protein